MYRDSLFRRWLIFWVIPIQVLSFSVPDTVQTIFGTVWLSKKQRSTTPSVHITVVPTVMPTILPEYRSTEGSFGTVFPTVDLSLVPTMVNTPTESSGIAMDSTENHTPTPSASETTISSPYRSTYHPWYWFRWSVILPLVSLSFMAWAAGREGRRSCTVPLVDVVPVDDTTSPTTNGQECNRETAPDIELVPVATFESWVTTAGGCGDSSVTGNTTLESASYILM